MYKSVLHDEIKSWLQILQRHNVVDWLIVLVEAYDFRKHNKLLPRTTVLDKIKGDFGVKHVDRYSFWKYFQRFFKILLEI